MRPIDNTDAELDAFDTVCRRMAGFSERIDTEWVDGYLTALAAGPLQIEIDDWLPRMCGDAFERAFADPSDEAQARAALLARVKVISNHLDPEALLDAPDELRLQPLMSAWDDDARRQLVDEGTATAEEAATLVTGALWVDGFFSALRDQESANALRPADADEEELSALEELMAHVSVLALDDGSAELKAHLERYYPKELPTREDLVDAACFAIQDMRVWWLDHAPRPPTRHVEATPGRNDPCPCGSGKKYKRCHGAA